MLSLTSKIYMQKIQTFRGKLFKCREELRSLWSGNFFCALRDKYYIIIKNDKSWEIGSSSNLNLFM